MMELFLKNILTIITSYLLLMEQVEAQYNIVRINPFKEISETLKTHHEEECEGNVMSLQCPEGTKVRNANRRVSVLNLI